MLTKEVQEGKETLCFMGNEHNNGNRDVYNTFCDSNEDMFVVRGYPSYFDHVTVGRFHTKTGGSNGILLDEYTPPFYGHHAFLVFIVGAMHYVFLFSSTVLSRVDPETTSRLQKQLFRAEEADLQREEDCADGLRGMAVDTFIRFTEGKGQCIVLKYWISEILMVASLAGSNVIMSCYVGHDIWWRYGVLHFTLSEGDFCYKYNCPFPSRMWCRSVTQTLGNIRARSMECTVPSNVSSAYMFALVYFILVGSLFLQIIYLAWLVWSRCLGRDKWLDRIHQQSMKEKFDDVHSCPDSSSFRRNLGAAGRHLLDIVLNSYSCDLRFVRLLSHKLQKTGDCCMHKTVGRSCAIACPTQVYIPDARPDSQPATRVLPGSPPHYGAMTCDFLSSQDSIYN